MLPLAALLFFLLGLNGHLLDLNYSARPLAQQLAQVSGPASTAAAAHRYYPAPVGPAAPLVAVYDVRRDIVYGLAFYRNQFISNYAVQGVPDDAHLLVIPTRDAGQLNHWLQGRLYQQVFLYETQGLSVYKVYARS